MAGQKRRILLIGDRDSKRRDFFIKAGIDLGTSVEFLDYADFLHKVKEGDCIKIDPPPLKKYCFSDLSLFIDEYKRSLDILANMKNISFLNHPDGLRQVLDKDICKNILKMNKVDVTPILGKNISDYSELIALIKSSGVSRVFIKPVFGSGAAGVIAFSYNAERDLSFAYTSLNRDKGVLVNTKSIMKTTDKAYNEKIVNEVLKRGAVVERWVPKKSVGGIYFDLRVICFLDKVIFIVPRGSKTPITNLHLNNMALSISELGLSDRLYEDIEQLCRRAMGCFPNLSCAGIDVLITQKDGRDFPCIIEINGQGDLIYKDIYKDNLIYKTQIKYMNLLIEGKEGNTYE